MKILLFGISVNHSLEKSYYRASVNLNIETHLFDYYNVLNTHIRGGRLGRMLNLFIPVEQWSRKMNRDFIVHCKVIQPDLILIFGNSRILYGTLCTIKIMQPNVKIAWIWPDTPLNMESFGSQNGLLVDLFGTYSSSSVAAFQQLNFNNVKWLPLGFDQLLHSVPVNKKEYYSVDISFVGGWRRERELVLEYIALNFPDLLIEIHGPGWKTFSQSKLVKSKVKSKGIYGVEMAKYFYNSRININVIDDTNYPAANMRFFEICGTGALQLCSDCLEMREIYEDFDSCLYFNSLDELKNKIHWVVNNSDKADELRLKAKNITLSQNTYVQRLQEIINILNLKYD